MKRKGDLAYDHGAIEKKWQKTWEKEEVYKTQDTSKKKKYYVLDMFPYPSGAGLHVGHPRGYIASDVYARLKRMQGFNVLHPMGFDSFGLPAEQYAITTGKHPGPFTDTLVKRYKKQLSIIGLSFDWSREISTHTPDYYHWTQWIFLKLYDAWYDIKKNSARPMKELVTLLETKGNKGVVAACDSDTATISAKEWKAFSKKEKNDFLMKYRLAYEGYAEVNWCAELGTVLANDEVLDTENGLVSERGGFPVVKKKMRQWFMRITAYGTRLVKDIESLDWPQSIKEIQKNWIGVSTGSEITFSIQTEAKKISVPVFTTRADTIMGVTYIVLAPEHPILETLRPYIQNWNEVQSYQEGAARKDAIERTADTKEKSGVPLRGLTATNPATKEEVPVWISDYVLPEYGTGAVMGVPMHDARDRAFAEKYELPIIDKPLVDAVGVTKKVGGKSTTKYKMRDAIFARQRYWGEPIPLRHSKEGVVEPLKEKELPLVLPNVKSYAPSGTGESPLAGIKAWTKEGYETNTMPGWAGSSWYFLRYIDPNNTKAFASKKQLEYWKDVDMYVGGAEHATGHLLYSRFWHKFLYDMKLVPTKEPFKALRNQGMIGGADGRKMSKRWGNIVNPDEVVATYGADSLRVFTMFLGPFNAHLPWSTEGIMGSRRFVERVWRLGVKIATDAQVGLAGKPVITNELYAPVLRVLHKTIKKVTEDIQTFSFNTAVSAMMICLNEFEKAQHITKKDFGLFLQLLAPFASHMTDELWGMLDEKGSIHLSAWPTYNKKFLTADTVTVGVQINGKVREELTIEADATEEKYKQAALALSKIKEYTEGKQVVKVVVVLGRIVNIVVKG